MSKLPYRELGARLPVSPSVWRGARGRRVDIEVVVARAQPRPRDGHRGWAVGVGVDRALPLGFGLGLGGGVGVGIPIICRPSARLPVCLAWRHPNERAARRREPRLLQRGTGVGIPGAPARGVPALRGRLREGICQRLRLETPRSEQFVLSSKLPRGTKGCGSGNPNPRPIDHPFHPFRVCVGGPCVKHRNDMCRGRAMGIAGEPPCTEGGGYSATYTR